MSCSVIRSVFLAIKSGILALNSLLTTYGLLRQVLKVYTGCEPLTVTCGTWLRSPKLGTGVILRTRGILYRLRAVSVSPSNFNDTMWVRTVEHLILKAGLTQPILRSC